MVSASTVSGNFAPNGTAAGGGINSKGGDFSLLTSTVSGNTAAGKGGGVYASGTGAISNSTIAFNTAASGAGAATASTAAVTFKSNIIAQNMGGISSVALAGNDASLGYNIVATDPGSTFPSGAGDVEIQATGADANLSALADNGGPTMTHAFTCPSIAYNAGDAADASADQRGMMVFGGRRDAGAYEIQTACSTNAVQPVAAALAATSIYPNPVTGVAVTIQTPHGVSGMVQVEIIEMASGRTVASSSQPAGTPNAGCERPGQRDVYYPA